MLLAIDVGNTNTVLGLYRLDAEIPGSPATGPDRNSAKPELAAHWRVTTHRAQTADEYGVLFVNLFQMNDLAPKQVTHIIISSVVPPLDSTLRQVCEEYFHIQPLFVEPGIKTGMPVLQDNPADLGADRVVNSIAAFERYGGPCIVVDFGTATTFDIISARGEYIGGAIAPGLGISADALFSRAARLGRVDIKRPPKVIGTNTLTHLQTGLYYGYIGSWMAFWSAWSQNWECRHRSLPRAAWQGKFPPTRVLSQKLTTCSRSTACSFSSSATATHARATGPTRVLNYFNYFTEIEERFQQRRGSLLLLSTLDWALIETWREAGIPLDAVLRGIDAAFDKYEARQKRARMRRINGLAWCSQAVMEAAAELAEAAAGTAPATANSRESGFEQERVAAHLESAATAMDAAAVAPEACSATALRLRELAAEVRAYSRENQAAPDGAAALDMEALERTLTVLEEKLFAALTAAAPEELLVGLKEHTARELAPYRSRMGAVQLRQVERQFVQKQLLVHYNLPRLSLFYMSQQ